MNEDREQLCIQCVAQRYMTGFNAAVNNAIQNMKEEKTRASTPLFVLGMPCMSCMPQVIQHWHQRYQN